MERVPFTRRRGPRHRTPTGSFIATVAAAYLLTAGTVAAAAAGDPTPSAGTTVAHPTATTSVATSVATSSATSSGTGHGTHTGDTGDDTANLNDDVHHDNASYDNVIYDNVAETAEDAASGDRSAAGWDTIVAALADTTLREQHPTATAPTPTTVTVTGTPVASETPLLRAPAALTATAAPAPPAPRILLRRPVPGPVISPFGLRLHPLLDVIRPHDGADLDAPWGAPVIAAAAGTVTAAGDDGEYGTTIRIDHGDGTSSVYAHLSAILVTVGAGVTAGQPIGQVGDSGLTTGPHLHFELRVNGTAVDPEPALPAPGDTGN